MCVYSLTMRHRGCSRQYPPKKRGQQQQHRSALDGENRQVLPCFDGRQNLEETPMRKGEENERRKQQRERIHARQ